MLVVKKKEMMLMIIARGKIRLARQLSEVRGHHHLRGRPSLCGSSGAVEEASTRDGGNLDES